MYVAVLNAPRLAAGSFIQERREIMSAKKMPGKQGPPKYRSKWPLWVIAAIIALAVMNHLFKWHPWPWEKEATLPPVANVEPATETKTETENETPRAAEKIIDFQDLIKNTDPDLGEMITSRKKEFGLKDSVDMVVGDDEAIRVGSETVTVKDILASIEEGIKLEDQRKPDKQAGGENVSGRPASNAGTGLEEEDLSSSSSSNEKTPPANNEDAVNVKQGKIKPVSFYGVHVVQPGDNLWNIHFAVLREYLKHKGHDIAENADESSDGKSTGVARILKFAESMVHIYNLKTRKLDKNLDLLEPNEKVVFFNLTRIDMIIGRIKPGELDRVQFDGTELYLPEQRPETQ